MRSIHPRCRLDDLLADLPEGIDTVIGNGKRVLSGDRRGLPPGPFWIKTAGDDFDEPTAHLDIETEMDLKSGCFR